MGPLISAGDGAATIVVSLAERRSLGAVAATRPAAHSKTPAEQSHGGFDPSEVAERIPTPETADHRPESSAARSLADDGGAGSEALGGGLDGRLDSPETAGAAPEAQSGETAFGQSAAESESPTGIPGLRGVDVVDRGVDVAGTAVNEVDRDADAAGKAAADFKRAFLERLSYPESARRAGATGTVGLLVRIDVEGRIAWARVRSSSGSSSLDRAALAAAKSVAGVTPPGVPLSVTIQAVFAPASP